MEVIVRNKKFSNEQEIIDVNEDKIVPVSNLISKQILNAYMSNPFTNNNNFVVLVLSD